MEEKKTKTQRTRRIPVNGEYSPEYKWEESHPASANSEGMGHESQKSKEVAHAVPRDPVADANDVVKRQTESHSQQNHSFNLRVSEAAQPSRNIKHTGQLHKKRVDQLKDIVRIKAGRRISIRIWNTLEWLATSALIFLVLFFALNYDSYFDLIKLKLDKIRGIVDTNPYIQKIVNIGQDDVTQALLPIVKTPEADKKQIPPLAMTVIPPDERIIIPRIDKNVPVVYVSTENLVKRDWSGLEKDIQEALRDGVVHYPGTAQPGDHGNVVITGHSSYFIWDPGNFKDVFALLHEVNVGDDIIVYYNQKKYLYKVYEKKVVMPDQIDVLTQKGEDRLTLITCTPVGTNLKRLVVLAKPE